MAKIKIANTFISLPDDYHETKDYELDGGRVFLSSTSNSNELLIVKTISEHDRIPWNKTSTIEGIRSFLNDNQGIVEVDQNDDYRSYQYVYSIVKNVDKEKGGVQYISTYQMKGEDGDIIMIQGNFIEAGQIGIRDTVVANKLIKKGEVGVENNRLTNWFCDPYDSSYTNGMPKNKAEDRVYDKEFKDHPLSRTRRLIKHLIKHNVGKIEVN